MAWWKEAFFFRSIHPEYFPSQLPASLVFLAGLAGRSTPVGGPAKSRTEQQSRDERKTGQTHGYRSTPVDVRPAPEFC